MKIACHRRMYNYRDPYGANDSDGDDDGQSAKSHHDEFPQLTMSRITYCNSSYLVLREWFPFKFILFLTYFCHHRFFVYI